MPPAPSPASEIRHASAVEFDGRAVLIEGPSGSGKSSLALQLIASGARLITDDRARLMLRDDWPWVLAPERLRGVIEARGVGLLSVPASPGAPLALVVDLAQTETERLPAPRVENVLGHEVMHVRRVDAPHFASAIVAATKGGFWRDV